eukprot:gene30266-37448_t
MGLMLGHFVDEYSIQVVDVFAMPQHGSGVSVEAVDEPFQVAMLDNLHVTGRPETVVGWYHSHPGFGVWLSDIDQHTQASFEKLNARCVAVVIDPVQSVKGRVIIDAFRLMPSNGYKGQQQGANLLKYGDVQDPRQTTSNVGEIRNSKATIQQLVYGLNTYYYSLVIDYRKNENEEQMLMNLYKKSWSHNLVVKKFETFQSGVDREVQTLEKFSKEYVEEVREELTSTEEEMTLKYVGKMDPKKHLADKSEELLAVAIVQSITTMLSTVVF